MFPTNNGDAGGSQQQQQMHMPAQRTGSNSSSGSQRNHTISQACIKIREQPAPKALRFRYECEGRSAGSIPGIRSTPDNKTYPTIEVVGFEGDAFVVVSCVTKDQPYKPHPHNLVGKDCKTGVCTVKMTKDSMAITFSNLGIQCVKKKDIEDALKKREEIKVDPFKTGFNHRNQSSSIDLNAVRLCFQVFVQGPKGLVALQPVVSEPIFDKKAMSELVICKLSDCSSPVAGGKDIILLCEKVAKDDISVRFFEEKDGHVVWEANGEFQQSNVHKQVAISFRTPAYRSLQVDHVVKVFVQLKRISDSAASDPLPFDYLPLDAVKRSNKRPRIENREQIYGHIRDHEQQQQQQQQQQQSDGRQLGHQNVPGGYLNIPVQPIKQEPRDNSPAFNLFGGYRVQQGTPSPQPPSPQNIFPQANAAMIGSPFQSPHNQMQMASPTPPQHNYLMFGATAGGATPTGGDGQNLFESQNPFQPVQRTQITNNNRESYVNYTQQMPASNNNNNTNNQWNIQQANGVEQMSLNDLSSVTNTFQPHLTTLMPANASHHIPTPLMANPTTTTGTQQQQQPTYMNIGPTGGSNSISNMILSDLDNLKSGDLLHPDQDNMTDSLTRLRLDMINEFGDIQDDGS